MGSGSFGGGGGGLGFSGGGGYRFEKGKITGVAQAQTQVQAEVKQILSKLSKEYLHHYFSSPMLRSIYEQLFILSVHVFQNQTWQGVKDEYGVDDGPGCLSQWVDALILKGEEQEPNQKVSETVRMCLDDFLIRALNNDLDMYLNGTGDQIIQNMKQEVFNNISGHFLSGLVWRVLQRDKERLNTESEAQLQDAAHTIAGRIIGSYERKFYAKKQNTWRDLFKVIDQNKEWFVKELRR